MSEKGFSAFEPTTHEDDNGDIMPEYGTDADGNALDPVNGPRFPQAETAIPHERYTDPTPPEATQLGEVGTSVIPANVRELARRARRQHPHGPPNSAAGATADYDDHINGRRQA